MSVKCGLTILGYAHTLKGDKMAYYKKIVKYVPVKKSYKKKYYKKKW